jgi:hypothetical protein
MVQALFVMAGLVPAIPIGMAPLQRSGSPAQEPVLGPANRPDPSAGDDNVS